MKIQFPDFVAIMAVIRVQYVVLFLSLGRTNSKAMRRPVSCGGDETIGPLDLLLGQPTLTSVLRL
jgi:hypothetical protein